MTSREFCYWLQGFLELSGAKELTEAQLGQVKEHLALSFIKVTPAVNYPPMRRDSKLC